MKNIFATIREHIARLRRTDLALFYFLAGAALVVIILGAILLSVDPPWDGDPGKRVAAGKDLRVCDYVYIGSWWAAVANFVIFGSLLATSAWWWGWTRGAAPEEQVAAPRKPKPVFRLLGWLGLGSALALALWIRIPQMNRYLMWDEQDNMRRNIYGYAEIDRKTGDTVFVDATWMKTFFEDRAGNNSVLASVASKACLTVWQKVTGEGKFRYSRVAIRAPSLAGGILSIIAFWIFLNLLGMPLAAVVCAFVLALHPLHIDYSIQARGYGMMMFFVGAACCCAVFAARSGRWRWFIGLGLSLFFTLAAFPGAVYFVVSFGGALAVWFGWRRFVRREKRALALLARLTVVGLIAGGLYLHLIVPSYIQIPFSEEFPGFPSAIPWLTTVYFEYATGAVFGAVWNNESVATRLSLPAYIYENVLSKDILYAILALGLVPMFTTLGFAAIWRRGGLARPILIGGCIAPAVAFTVHRFIIHIMLHGWYLIYFLPFFAMMLGGGLAATASWLSRRIPVVGPSLGPVLIAAFLVCFWHEAKPDQYERRPLPTTPLDPDTGQEFSVYTRGPNNWVIYEDGRMIRQLKEDPIPERFPFNEADLTVVTRP